MKAIAIVYGSSGGSTKAVANTIAKQLNSAAVKVFDVASISSADIEQYDYLILGTSTWGLGDLQDDWQLFLPKLLQCNLQHKTIALFGLGDSQSYSDTFVDGMGTLYNALNGRCTIIGTCSVEGYTFSSSTAVQNGFFVGLPLDDDNESTLTNNRIGNWIATIWSQFS